MTNSLLRPVLIGLGVLLGAVLLGGLLAYALRPDTGESHHGPVTDDVSARLLVGPAGAAAAFAVVTGAYVLIDNTTRRGRHRARRFRFRTGR